MTQALQKSVLIAAWEPARSSAWLRELADLEEWTLLPPVHSMCEAQMQLEQCRPALLITDLRLPDGTAVDLVRSHGQTLGRSRICPPPWGADDECRRPGGALTHDRYGNDRQAYADATATSQILVMTQGPDVLLLEALQEGADNFLDDAELGAQALSRHARDTLAGGAHMAPWVARRLLDFFGVHNLARPHPGLDEGFGPLELSRTERHLLRQLSIGQRMADVARALGLAPREAAGRVRAIYRKMQWALRAGDLTLSPSP